MKVPPEQQAQSGARLTAYHSRELYRGSSIVLHSKYNSATVAVGTQILQGVSLSETQASAIQLVVQLFCFPPTIPKGSIVKSR